MNAKLSPEEDAVDYVIQSKASFQEQILKKYGILRLRQFSECSEMTKIKSKTHSQ
jgi:hypothetical protein